MMDFKTREDALTNTPSDLCEGCKKQKGTNAKECDKCLDYLNYARMMISFGKEQDVSSIQAGAVVTLHHYLDVAKMDISQIYKFQKRLEALHAEVAAIYTSLKIKARIPNAEKAEKAKDFKKATDQQKLDNAPKADKKRLDARDKAIKALTDIGLSYEVAAASVDKRLKEQGKVTGLEGTVDSLKKG